MHQGTIAPSGELGLVVTRGARHDWPTLGRGRLSATVAHALPSRGLPDEVNRWRRANARNVARGLWRHVAATKLGVGHFTGSLYLDLIRGDGTVVPLGLASMRVVTNNGVGYIVDAFQNIVELENMKYHGYGTGTNAEAVGDSALQTELTTQYNPDSTRPTGTTTENGSNVYRTVATLTPDSGGTIAVTEHGIFSATSAGTLLDRSVFSAVNLVAANGDSLQSTYDLTLTAGS
jgi:hypothetical protein